MKQPLKSSLANGSFYLALGVLLTHELDAMSNEEWRVLPLLRWLEPALGEVVFVVAHIPLLAVVIALIASKNLTTRRYARIGVAAFTVIHAGLHATFSGHVHYEFDSVLSTMLIYGAGLFGFLFLLLNGRPAPSASVER